ncbi:MAG: hypothetical protein HY754_04375, partial [Nitrospirae bacterium]|nr:hypothetical protein [Nitrospirota bacterium]
MILNKIKIRVCSLIAIFVIFLFANAGQAGQRLLKVRVDETTSLSEFIASLGYDIDDGRLNNFLEDFVFMNSDLKGLAIPAGTTIRLPLRYLKPLDKKPVPDHTIA